MKKVKQNTHDIDAMNLEGLISSHSMKITRAVWSETKNRLIGILPSYKDMLFNVVEVYDENNELFDYKLINEYYEELQQIENFTDQEIYNKELILGIANKVYFERFGMTPSERVNNVSLKLGLI